MSFADNMALVVAELAETFGETLSLKSISQTMVPPSRGSVETITTYTFTGTVGPVKLFNRDGSFVRVLMATIPATDVGTAPKPQDILVRGSIEHRVLGVEALGANGVTVAYKLNLGKL